MPKIENVETFHAVTGGKLLPPPRLVISDWLRLQHTSAQTPFEAAGEIMRQLQDFGYQIVPEKK